MQSSETTVAGYVKSLPPERALVIKEMRSFVNKHLDTGYEETMRWGMISWEVPLKTFPKTYNNQPLSYVALASQKNYFSLYLMALYMGPNWNDFESAFKASGMKMDMGKSCLRFKSVGDLPLPLIGRTIADYSVADFIKLYEESRAK